MKKISSKSKIYLFGAAWLVLCVVMFAYAFKIYDSKNGQLVSQIGEKRKELLALEAEQQSFQQAQSDLKKLEAYSVQPDDLFSRDVTLVKEIKALESMAQKYNVELSIGNLSGTVKSATKAKTVGDMVFITASLNVKGDFSNIVSFMENLENASFVTNVTGFTVMTAEKGLISASLNTQFYLKR